MAIKLSVYDANGIQLGVDSGETTNISVAQPESTKLNIDNYALINMTDITIVQKMGQDPEVVMSQKAVTDAILSLSTNVVNSINGMSGVVEIDYSDVGAVSANLSIYPTSTANLTPSARDKANIYIDDSGVSGKISLQQIKNMSTKILSTNSLQDSEINNLDTNDYVFKKE